MSDYADILRRDIVEHCSINDNPTTDEGFQNCLCDIIDNYYTNDVDILNYIKNNAALIRKTYYYACKAGWEIRGRNE